MAPSKFYTPYWLRASTCFFFKKYKSREGGFYILKPLSEAKKRISDFLGFLQPEFHMHNFSFCLNVDIQCALALLIR